MTSKPTFIKFPYTEGLVYLRTEDIRTVSLQQSGNDWLLSVKLAAGQLAVKVAAIVQTKLLKAVKDRYNLLSVDEGGISVSKVLKNADKANTVITYKQGDVRTYVFPKGQKFIRLTPTSISVLQQDQSGDQATQLTLTDEITLSDINEYTTLLRAV